MQRRTWSRARCWPAGSGGPIWSSPAWRTRRRSNSSGRSHGRRSAAGRRSSWPNGTAGPTSRPLAAPTSHSQARCSARGGPMRQSPGSSGPSAPSCRKPSPQWGWVTRFVRGLRSWRAAASPTRWPPAGGRAAFGHLAAPHGSYFVTWTRGLLCTRWCAWAPSTAPSRSWAACVTRTATAARPASPRRCCGWPRTTHARRPPRSRRFWTAPPPWPGRTGGSTFSCWRRSSGTRSATGTPPGARSSVPSISPSLIACSSRSSSTVRRGCWSATPGTAPNTRPRSRRSSPCFHHWSQAPRYRSPLGIRGPKRYWEAESPSAAKSGLGEIVPPN